MSEVLSLISAGTIAAVVLKAAAVFAFVSWCMTGVSTLLSTIGDKTPGWVGSIASFCAKATALLNGLKL